MLTKKIENIRVFDSLRNTNGSFTIPHQGKACPKTTGHVRRDFQGTSPKRPQEAAHAPGSPIYAPS